MSRQYTYFILHKRKRSQTGDSVMNVLNILESKDRGDKLVMITAYDYTSARLIGQSDIDLILVGDSAAMVMHGHDSTLPISNIEMAGHVAAVKRGAPDSFIIGDLPFLSYRRSLSENMASVCALMQAGANAVKLEGLAGNRDTITHIVQSGVPVMGHLGLTPQSVNSLGGYRVQGRSDAAHHQLLTDAHALQEAGCFSLVLECVPSELAREVTEALDIPVIGIGAGVHVDGQVLVMQDLLGLNTDFKPSFVRSYMDGAEQFKKAFDRFAADVRSGEFPSEAESFS